MTVNTVPQTTVRYFLLCAQKKQQPKQKQNQKQRTNESERYIWKDEKKAKQNKITTVKIRTLKHIYYTYMLYSSWDNIINVYETI